MKKSFTVSLSPVEMSVARHSIQIPDTDNFCTVRYYSEENNLTAFTVVEFTGSEFGIILGGDKFLTVINYMYRLIQSNTRVKSLWSETIWMDHIVPDICNKYGGHPRRYKPTG